MATCIVRWVALQASGDGISINSVQPNQYGVSYSAYNYAPTGNNYTYVGYVSAATDPEALAKVNKWESYANPSTTATTSSAEPCIIFVFVENVQAGWKSPTFLRNISKSEYEVSGSMTGLMSNSAHYITYSPDVSGGKLVFQTTADSNTYDFYSHLSTSPLSANSESTDREAAVIGNIISSDDDGGGNLNTKIEYSNCKSGTTYYWYVNVNYAASGFWTINYQMNYYNGYSITYHENGGIFPSGVTALTKFYEDNLYVTFLSSSQRPTRNGYTLIGWSTDKNATTAMYSLSGGTLSEAKNITLYAVWKKNSITITYNTNGGDNNGPSQQEMDLGATVTIDTSTHPTKTNYIFKGWATNNTAKEATYKKNTMWSISGLSTDLVLYAVWWPELTWTNHSIAEANKINEYVNTYCGTTGNENITPGTIYKWSWIDNIAKVLHAQSAIQNIKIISNNVMNTLKEYYDKF